MKTRIQIMAGLMVLGLATWAGLVLFAKEPRDDSNYSKMDRRLYLGGLVEVPPPGTKAVLNLCEFEDSYQVPHQMWAKIPDSPPAPNVEWIQKAVDFVDANQKQDRTTYVHCFAGISRGAMVVTAYYMSKNNWTRDEALKFVRSKRSFVNPNDAFMERLLEYEKVIAKRAK